MLTRAFLKNPYAVSALYMIMLVLSGVSHQKMVVGNSDEPDGAFLRGVHLAKRCDPVASALVVPIEGVLIS